MSQSIESYSDIPPKPTKKQLRHSRSSHRYISLEGRSTLLRLAILGTCFSILAISVGSGYGTYQFPDTFNDTSAPHTNELEGQLTLAVGVATNATLVFYFFTIVLLCMFMYRANANLRRMGVSGLEFTPGWCVGWWFVPFANLFKPYQAMVELQRFSEQPGGGSWSTNPAVHWWWGCWIAGVVVTQVTTRLTGHVSTEMVIGTDMAGSIITAISGLLLIVIVGRITDAQTRYHDELAGQRA